MDNSNDRTSFPLTGRQAAQSTIASAVTARCLSLVQRLRSGEDPLRLARFLVVGVTTLFINSLLLAFWTEVAGIYYLISAALATQGATVCGFCMTEFWVFPERRSRRGRIPRFAKFLLMNNVVLALRGPLLYVLTSGLGLHYLVSNIISVGVLTLIRYALADTWIWRKARPAEMGSASGFHSLADLD